MTIKIDLNLPADHSQRLFLDYFNSELRKRLAGYSGSASFRPDGLFESSVTGPFPIDQGTVVLSWKIVKSETKELLFVEVSEAEQGTSTLPWQTAAHELVKSVLIAALTQKRKAFFRRVFFSYIGVQLDGEYWLKGMRFAPAWPEDPDPHLLNAERVVSLDLSINAIDDMDAWSLAEAEARRQSARLSLLLDIGLFKSSNSEARWVIMHPEDNANVISKRLQLGFVGYGPSFDSMPAKGQSCQLGQFRGSLMNRYRIAGELLSLPPEARKILRSIDSASPSVIEAFDNGARLYQVAATVGNQFPSLGLAYRIAAVEAISNAEKSCKSFSDFIRKYAMTATSMDDLLNYMYGAVRSAHFHAGQFPLGEYAGTRFFDPLMDSDQIYNSNIHRMCFEITREAIINWIVSLLPKDTEESSSNGKQA
jgi:hypothetical protein